MYKKEFYVKKINLRKEYKIGMNIIADLVFKNGGIIYGGYVRDHILREYYSEKYYIQNIDKKELNKKYWEPDYNEDTKYRRVLPKDIDICFKNEEDYKKFYTDIVIKFDEINIYKYGDGRINHKDFKINATYNICRTFYNKGKDLLFTMDITIDKDFKSHTCLDFITNGLVFKNSKDNVEILKLYEKYFKINHYHKYETISKIIKLIQERKTLIVRHLCCENDTVKLITKAINMIQDDWEILNLNFIRKCKDEECSQNNCCICFENKPDIVLCNNSYFCYKCLHKYIKEKGTIYEEDNNIYIKNPMRNVVKLDFVHDLYDYIETI